MVALACALATALPEQEQSDEESFHSAQEEIFHSSEESSEEIFHSAEEGDEETAAGKLNQTLSGRGRMLPY